MITQDEFNEYLKLKKQMDLIDKVESRIYQISRAIEEHEGYDAEYADENGSRMIAIENDKIKVSVECEYNPVSFEIPKKLIFEDDNWSELAEKVKGL